MKKLNLPYWQLLYIIIAVFFIALSGCDATKKSQKKLFQSVQLDSSVAAKYCATTYPIRSVKRATDSTKFVQWRDSIREVYLTDTFEIEKSIIDSVPYEDKEKLNFYITQNSELKKNNFRLSKKVNSLLDAILSTPPVRDTIDNTNTAEIAACRIESDKIKKQSLIEKGKLIAFKNISIGLLLLLLLSIFINFLQFKNRK